MEARLRSVGPLPLARELSGYAAAALLGLLWLCALLLLVRRFYGALEHSPAPTALLAAALPALGAATAWRLGRGFTATGRGRRRAVGYWLPAIPLVLLGVALSLPGASPVGLSLFWAMLLLGEAAAWRYLFPRADRCDPASQPARWHARAPQPAASFADDVPLDDRFDQQTTRRRENDGSEVIEGYLRLELAPGQRSGAAHVAFCPPLNEVPQFSVEQLGGPSARVKVAQVLPYGARVEFKLQSASEGASPLLLAFAALSSRRAPMATG